MVRNDTMWAGCVYAGKVFVVDVSDKSNPLLLDLPQPLMLLLIMLGHQIMEIMFLQLMKNLMVLLQLMMLQT